MSRSICHQTEAALVFAMKSIQTSGPLGPVNITEGQSVDIAQPMTYPAVTLVASSPMPLDYPASVYELKLIARIETDIDAETPTPSNDVHHDRVAFVRCFFEDVDTLIGLVNAPLVPPDERQVQDFALTAVVFEGEAQMTADRVMTTELSYYICASS